MKGNHLLQLLLALSLQASAEPITEKIGVLLSKIVFTPYTTSYSPYWDSKVRAGIHIFPAVFDHSDNLWVFWKEYIGEWQECPFGIIKEKIPPRESGIFCKKISRTGKEIISKKLLYKGDVLKVSVPRHIFIGPDNSLYLRRVSYLERRDSLGNLMASSKKLGRYLSYPFIWFDTLNDRIFFHHTEPLGEREFNTFDAKNLAVLNNLIMSKADKGIPLPPNTEWVYRHHDDAKGSYEVDQNKYVATDWFSHDTILVCGARNPIEGFIHKININDLVLIDSFSFEIAKNAFRQYENVSLPKVQIVKGKNGFWVFIPLREREKEWVSVIRLDSIGKLVSPAGTKIEKPKDFDRVPTRMPKQILVKQIGSEYEVVDKVWELEVDFFGFDTNGNLYYSQYKKKKR